MANYVSEAPWKISFNTAGNGPFAVRMKLADLLFDQTTNPWAPLTVGVHLPHDIILFDPAIYSSSGGTLDSSASREARQSRAFYLTKVTYDARANAIWIANAAYKDGGYFIYPQESALPILETDYTLHSNKTYYNTDIANPTDRLNPNDPSTDESTNPLMTYQSSCSVAIADTSAAASSFLILSAPDRALQATIPGSSVVPYARMRFQTDVVGIPEVIDILTFFTEFGINPDGTAKINPATGDPYNALQLIDPAINTRLQTMEIWIRCSFFADYIVPETFNQDLAQTSQVAHKNLVVGLGDYRRYTREAPTAETKPYLPATPPRNDLLQVPTAAAAPFPIPSYSGTYDSAGTGHRAPLGWYDPDYPDETNPANKLVAIPEEGNAYVSGRIFSPTIDELWTYIKKMVDGQGTGAVTSIPPEPVIALTGGDGDPLTADGSIFVVAPTSFTFALDAVIKSTLDSILGGLETYVNTTGMEPRANPYSLRETECNIRNVQYNLRAIVGYIAENLVHSGNTSPVQGTLFQLHKDFDPKHATNTLWVNKGTAAPSSLLPTSPAGYDSLADFSAEDVYMGADGQWHHLFDQVRVPIIDETY
jgi:hypothetical protein